MFSGRHYRPPSHFTLSQFTVPRWQAQPAWQPLSTPPLHSAGMYANVCLYTSVLTQQPHAWWESQTTATNLSDISNDFCWTSQLKGELSKLSFYFSTAWNSYIFCFSTGDIWCLIQLQFLHLQCFKQAEAICNSSPGQPTDWLKRVAITESSPKETRHCGILNSLPLLNVCSTVDDFSHNISITTSHKEKYFRWGEVAANRD